MNSIAQQLKAKFEKAFTAAFGESYAGADPMLAHASDPNFWGLSVQRGDEFGEKVRKAPTGDRLDNHRKPRYY